MRLLTHNSLRCATKNVIKGYPLGITVEDYEVRESEFNKEFMMHVLPTLEWEGVLIAARVIGIEGMPECFDISLVEDDEFLLAMHNLLLDVHIIKGTLICPESGKTFQVQNGIADMMVEEEEV